jgi:hypothetical protein
MNFKFDKDNNDNFLKDKKIAITVGYFYQEIGDKLLIGAQQTLSKYGIDENNVDIQINIAFQSSPWLPLHLYCLYNRLLYRWFAPYY